MIHEHNQRRIKKALVTGAAGFIGSHLAEALVKKGVEVVAIDDLSAGKTENLESVRSSGLLKEVIGDITNKNQVYDAMQGVDTVFHLAASKKNICLINPHRDLEVNGGGTLNLLQAAVDLGVEHFVHASTGSVYGSSSVFPQTETNPLHPVSFYGVSKLAGESYVRTFSKIHGLNTTVLRYFHVYGPRQESSDVGGVVSIFIKRALTGEPLIIHGDGLQMRTFTWVGDVVESNIKSATNSSAIGKIYNCASGIRVTVLDLASLVSQILGKTLKIKHGSELVGDIREFDVSNTLIRDDLGITFETDFRRGLEVTVKWGNQYFLNRPSH